jgi:hypothetical protein
VRDALSLSSGLRPVATGLNAFSVGHVRTRDDLVVVVGLDEPDDYAVLRVSRAGAVTPLLENRDIKIPHGLLTDAAGNVYVLAELTILKVFPDGRVVRIAGQEHRDGMAAARGQLTSPVNVAADARGWVYVSDSFRRVYLGISPEGAMRVVAGRMYHETPVTHGHPAEHRSRRRTPSRSPPMVSTTRKGGAR